MSKQVASEVTKQQKTAIGIRNLKLPTLASKKWRGHKGTRNRIQGLERLAQG